MSVVDDKGRGGATGFWSGLFQFPKAFLEEKDPVRAITLGVALGVGLTAYHFLDDCVMGAGAFLATFLVGWGSAEPARKRLQQWSQKRRTRRGMKALFASLGYQERRVVEDFVHWGGYVIECKDSYATSAFPGSGIESLASRGLLRYDMTVDGYRETYVLDKDLYDYARTVVDEIPF